MKQCWKSNTENTELTDSETVGGNKGKHPKMQWERKMGTLKISNSSSRNSYFQREAPWGRLQHRTFKEHRSSLKPLVTADRNTQVHQMEEAALLQDSVWASLGSAAVSGKIPWSSNQAAIVPLGWNDHSGNSLSSLSSCSIQAPLLPS